MCKTDALYHFFKLMNVAILAVCGIVGIIFLRQGMFIVSAGGKEGSGVRRMVMWLWVFVYAFVGSQMAWTLRPFKCADLWISALELLRGHPAALE